MRSGKRVIFVLLFLVSFVIPSQGQAAKPVNAALMSVKNLDTNPQFDYLGGMIQGLLLYDYSGIKGMTLVDRSSMDKVVGEQQLSTAGIVSDPGSAAKIGKMLGAHQLIFCEYVVMGAEALITLRVVNVESGKVSVFTERGRTENIVHLLAEKSAEYLTGVKVPLRSVSGDRSLISLKDEAPGSIALHSAIVRAEIFIDNEFAGYTRGNAETPSDLPNLKPGPHTVRVHLGNAWGVVDLPQFRFRDWEETVNVQAGKRHVVRDKTRDFNGIIYDAISLYYLDCRLSEDKLAEIRKGQNISFIDREGKKIAISFSSEIDVAKGICHLAFIYNGKPESIRLPLEPKAENRMVKEIGKVKVELRLINRSDPGLYRMSVERTDIWQGMYDGKPK